jgi:hypothetical protein
MSVLASLHVLLGDSNAGTRFFLGQEHTVLGRSSNDCDIAVPSTWASRRHALISRRGDRFVLLDLNSRNGTHLNDRRIGGLSPLRDGDRIRISDFEAAFESRVGPMTEGGWLGSSNSQAMLVCLWAQGRASERRLGLFADWCRQFGRLGPGGTDPAGVADAWLAAAETGRLAAEAATATVGGLQPPEAEDSSEWDSQDTRFAPSPGWYSQVGRLFPASDAAEGVLCELLRDLWGNPFRPPQIDRIVLREGSTVVRLAQSAEDNLLPGGTLAEDHLAVLADALEDAGCTDAAILGHLRGPGPHVRGCWALDAILGRT